MEASIPASARRRYAAGRRIVVPKKVKSTRDVMKRHLREEGIGYDALAVAWNMKSAEYVKHRIWRKTPLSPQYIDAFIELVKLDDRDALELRFLAAVEAGWQIAELGMEIKP
ncbi:hypothetical protein DLP3_129 [Stenotrophomonas phage vB_SmaS_DLP_3]|nr:hypothetical protein DLP3_129 [Stenotrophomonas phage vB_SmaS_DLP_3]